MTNQHTVRTGIALSITVGLGYSACTLVFWLWPEASATFMNGLFHGLDFRKLQTGASLFSFGSFAYALVVMMGWTFLLGSIFGWLQNRLHGGRP